MTANPNALLKTRVGAALVFVYFVLMFLAAVQNPDAFQTTSFYWFAVATIFAAAIYYLVAVYVLHRELRAATGGAYVVSPRKGVGFHFAPLFNIYWALKWTAEVARFIAAAAPDRKIPIRLPGVLIVLGFFLGNAFDGGLSVLVNFAVLGWLSRHAKAGLANPGAAEAYAAQNAGRKLNMTAIWIGVAVCLMLTALVTFVNLAALPPDGGSTVPVGAAAPAAS